jgi:hypothetical protein
MNIQISFAELGIEPTQGPAILGYPPEHRYIHNGAIFQADAPTWWSILEWLQPAASAISDDLPFFCNDGPDGICGIRQKNDITQCWLAHKDDLRKALVRLLPPLPRSLPQLLSFVSYTPSNPVPISNWRSTAFALDRYIYSNSLLAEFLVKILCDRSGIYAHCLASDQNSYAPNHKGVDFLCSLPGQASNAFLLEVKSDNGARMFDKFDEEAETAKLLGLPLVYAIVNFEGQHSTLPRKGFLRTINAVDVPDWEQKIDQLQHLEWSDAGLPGDAFRLALAKSLTRYFSARG